MDVINYDDLSNNMDSDVVKTEHKTIKFEVKNYLPLNIDNNNNYYLEHLIIRDGDAIDNIAYESTKRIKCEYRANGVCCDSSTMNEIVSIALDRTNIVLRITFLEPPTNDDYVTMSCRHLYMVDDLRKKVMRGVVKTSSGYTYNDGYICVSSVV